MTHSVGNLLSTSLSLSLSLSPYPARSRIPSACDGTAPLVSSLFRFMLTCAIPSRGLTRIPTITFKGYGSTPVQQGSGSNQSSSGDTWDSHLDRQCTSTLTYDICDCSLVQHYANLGGIESCAIACDPSRAYVEQQHCHTNGYKSCKDECK